MVYSQLFCNAGSCIHYLGILIPCLAKNIAIVSPSLFYKIGLCSHSFGGIIPFSANNVATVSLVSF